MQLLDPKFPPTSRGPYRMSRIPTTMAIAHSNDKEDKENQGVDGESVSVLVSDLLSIRPPVKIRKTPIYFSLSLFLKLKLCSTTA